MKTKIKFLRKVKLSILLLATPFAALLGAWQVGRIYVSEMINNYKQESI